nr:helix-turn-helix domain-containing protein [Pseudomonas sp. OIL-1]
MEGTNWRNLLVQVLVSSAQQRLRSARISVQQVADELGYADPSRFSHASKRWTGLSPLEFKNSQ